MKLKHAINLHKGLTAFVVLGMMAIYQNFQTGPWIYLALHGTYGFLWLLKDRIYPDKQWEEELPLPQGIVMFLVLGAYWVAPWLLISRGVEVPPALLALAVSCNLFGCMLHYTADAQKHFTLKYRRGLITEGFFARCRNTNYLGEILIYLGFAILPMHPVPFLILAGFVLGIFVPNMRKKDQSLSRYPEFADYQAQSGLVWPQLWAANKPSAVTEK
ncbi:DUF1295 domain-containing protein [Leptothoe kymatousa]|uniref:DUF1295 domain-containing protein n=1 Tax=Leptothoe kymatousa TAU-MAC 1615 TaxID=2364775 RepID=A0ABS5Y047_9CYAN|nr:DUF1295 domain-containing protein [Leptothoe kymatousa]MBT9311186.1 DUF1295 domain-containing protein [Leptothoe kymatousa TAU-MAC 1615]